MQVILLKTVPKLGLKFEIKNVSPGYARNFLLPKKIAILATKSSLLELEKLKEKEVQAKEALGEEWEALIKKTKGLILKIEAKASQEGKLFGSVAEQEIREALTKKKIALAKEIKIGLEKPLKKTGDYEVNLVFDNKKMPFRLEIRAFGQEKKAK